jgi:hypothetical protein
MPAGSALQEVKMNKIAVNPAKLLGKYTNSLEK